MSSEKNVFILPSMTKEALDNLPFGVYVINQDGVIEFFNKAMADISGVKRAEEIEGQNVFKIPNYRKYGLDNLVKLGLDGEPFRVEGIRYISYLGKKESFRSYYGIPVKDEKGEVVRLLCIVEDTTERRKNAEQLAKSVKEKEILLKEINHRLKNNIQVIYSLFNLQCQKVGDPEAVRLFRETRDQIKGMLMIHEQLYRSKDLSSIDFSRYIGDLVANLFSAYGAKKDLIARKIEIADVELNVSQAIPCALIVNELVTNAIKYAFPGGRKGGISVFLRSAAGHYELGVEDDGVGFSSDLNIDSNNTLGITLVRTLAEQIGGEVDITDAGGIKAKVTFPA